MQSSIKKLREKIDDAESANYLCAASLKDSKLIALKLQYQLFGVQLNELKSLATSSIEYEHRLNSDGEIRGFSNAKKLNK